MILIGTLVVTYSDPDPAAFGLIVNDDTRNAVRWVLLIRPEFIPEAEKLLRCKVKVEGIERGTMEAYRSLEVQKMEKA